VAIGKGQHARLIVPARRHVYPAFVWLWPRQEVRVINTIFVLVDEHEQLAWVGRLRQSQHRALHLVRPPAPTAAHGITARAPRARCAATDLSHLRPVSRTAVGLQGAIVIVLEQEAVADVRVVITRRQGILLLFPAACNSQFRASLHRPIPLR